VRRAGRQFEPAKPPTDFGSIFTSPASGSCRRKGGISAPQVELLEALILLLLVPDVFSDDLLIPSHCGDVVASGPEVLPYEISLSFPIDPGQMDRTPLMNPTTCDTAYFGGIDIIMCT
jgi:hypothetical protein